MADDRIQEDVRMSEEISQMELSEGGRNEEELHAEDSENDVDGDSSDDSDDSTEDEQVEASALDRKPSETQDNPQPHQNDAPNPPEQSAAQREDVPASPTADDIRRAPPRPPPRVYFQDTLDAEASQDVRVRRKPQVKDSDGSVIADDVDMILQNQQAIIYNLITAFRIDPPAKPHCADERFDDPKVVEWWDEWQRIDKDKCEELDRSDETEWEMVIESRLWKVLREVISIHRNGPRSGKYFEDGMSCSARLKTIQQVITDIVGIRVGFCQVTSRLMDIEGLASAPRWYAEEYVSYFWGKVRHGGEDYFASLAEHNRRVERGWDAGTGESQNKGEAAQEPAQHTPQSTPQDQRELHGHNASGAQLEAHPDQPVELVGHDTEINNSAASGSGQRASLDTNGVTQIENAAHQHSGSHEYDLMDTDGTRASTDNSPNQQPNETPQGKNQVHDDVAHGVNGGDGAPVAMQTDAPVSVAAEELTEQPKGLTAEQKAQRKAAKKERRKGMTLEEKLADKKARKERKAEKVKGMTEEEKLEESRAKKQRKEERKREQQEDEK